MGLMIPIFAIIGAFGAPVLIIWIVYYFSGRTEKRFHTTLQDLIKSDQQLTPEMLATIPGYRNNGDNTRNDIRTGTITFSVGAGIALFGAVGLGEETILGIGLLVSAIGLGLLLYGRYDKKVQLADDVG
jgi:hypothetical protein